jgi:YidC/Oxa1 family membrane protein insertase
VELWTLWIEGLRDLLLTLSLNLGLGFGLSIVALTLMLRTVLLPISWPSAYRGCIRQRKMTRLQPELQRVREQCADRPELFAQKTLTIYRKHGLTPIDGRSLLGGLAQMPIFLGMFQVLRDGIGNVRFLWVQNLSRPDFWLAVLAALTTALMILANADLPANMRALMVILPSVIALVMALKFCSALAVYWTASNCFSALQTSVLHWTIERRIKTGALKI